MGDEVSVTVASISDIVTSSELSSVLDAIVDAFDSLVNIVLGEPLLMFGLTFAAVAGLTGLVFKVVRRLGFKAHR